MRNWWIRLGCFLTGYNYSIVKNSSEATAKAVKKYTSAVLIVCILWAFVGYTFTQRYLIGTTFASMAGAIIAVVVIVQIERQIILSINPNKGLYIFRGFLALMMSIIGAVIIDQIILKQDIELEKMSYITKRVNDILPSKTKELQNQIFALDTTIQTKERERQRLIDDVAQSPVIKVVSSQTQAVPVTTTVRDTAGSATTSTILKPSTTVMVSNVANPKQALIPPLDTLIGNMREQKAIKDGELLDVRPALEKEISEKVGFLDELKVMYSLISHSGVALSFWLLWLFFLLFLEMLVLFSKIGDKENDYDRTVLHHRDLQIHKLNVLAKMANGQ